MDVTSKLQKVFSVEKLIRGLKSRSQAAEKFLAEQDKQLAAIDSKKSQLEQQTKTLMVNVKSAEGEVARLDARMNTLKTQMDSAQTNKEYKALLTEHSTLKVDKDKHETTVLEAMTKVDELKKQVTDLDTQRAERVKVREVAAADKQARESEVAGRLAELTAERTTAAAEVPKDVMSQFERLLETRGEDAMAPIEELSRKHMEYTCGACQMTLTMNVVTGLLNGGKATRCSSCQCFLYIDKELAEALVPAKR